MSGASHTAPLSRGATAAVEASGTGWQAGKRTEHWRPHMHEGWMHAERKMAIDVSPKLLMAEFVE